MAYQNQHMAGKLGMIWFVNYNTRQFFISLQILYGQINVDILALTDKMIMKYHVEELLTHTNSYLLP